MIFKLRDSIEIRVKQEEIYFNDLNSSLIHTFEVDKNFIDFIKKIPDKFSLEDLKSMDIIKENQITLQDIEIILNELLQFNIIEIDEIQYAVKSDERYHRQLLFFESLHSSKKIAFKSLEKLLNAHVLIVGVGGIGSWLSYYLVQMGIGELTIIDDDIVEESNLTRQALYTINDINKFKVDAIEEHLKLINPNLMIHKYKYKIENETVNNSVFKGVNVVVNCADSPSFFTVDRIVSEICMSLKLPHIIGGGYLAHYESIGPTIIPYETPCFGCYEHAINNGIIGNKRNKEGSILIRKAIDSKGASFNLLASSIANSKASEVVRLVTNIDTPNMIGKVGEMSFFDENWQYFSFKRVEDCYLCSK